MRTHPVGKLLERHCAFLHVFTCANNLCVFTWGLQWNLVKHHIHCSLFMPFTHAKISHLVASLPTSRQQVVFALLVPSCQQVWNKLLTTCNNLVDIRFVARLFQQVRYSHDIAILLQPCVVKFVTFLCIYHDCIRIVRTTCLISRAGGIKANTARRVWQRDANL